MTREGYIEKIIYKSEETGYCVLSVEGEEGEEIFVGNLPGAGEGLYVIAEGEYVNHPQYDIQFKFSSCEIRMPKDTIGIERYLGSGIVKGVGAVLAKKIVKKFGDDSLRIIEEEPERLAEISGISERKARAIAISYLEKKEFQDVVIFLAEYGISVNLAIRIYNTYGSKVYDVVKGNPYKLAEDISGVGFRIADMIARRMGVASDSVFRLRSSILYALNMAGNEGHMYLPKQVLIRKCVELTRDAGNDVEGIYGQSTFGYGEYEDETSGASAYEQAASLLEQQLVELMIAGKVVAKTLDGEDVIYSAPNYYVELNTARLLTDLQLRYDMEQDTLLREIEEIEKEEKLTLDVLQREAVMSAIEAGVAVITGGPGTGKTTIINVIIKYFSKKGMEIKLCAPTGRAAKRMTESTGWPAQTIHRLLEISGVVDDSAQNQEDRGMHFTRNADNPLECDAIIVDEMSMVDSYIFYALLQAIPYGTRLIMVGDVNQLPSVGAGNVLRDIIRSDVFPVTTLNHIFRQEDGSDIVFNAHKIYRGEHITMSNKSKDFFFIVKRTAAQIVEEVQTLTMKNLPNYYGFTSQEIQVLCPTRKYEVGVENMNRRLQDKLNPKSSAKTEHSRGDVIFRKGDKVMQIKNNYQMEWKIYGISKTGNGKGYVIDEGIGVFNGDMGVITDISDFDEELTVLFDDGRECVYGFRELDQIEHAFAVTIHKSQGSEYPAVVIPLLGGNRKLMNRNLIYTAITRARQLVVIVGDVGLVNQMIDNTEEQKRYTSLTQRLQEMVGGME
ncbi:MAG: AAA family ATPase [Wujia sp.]